MLKKILFLSLLLPSLYIHTTPREVALAATFAMFSAEGLYVTFHKKDSSNLEQVAGMGIWIVGMIGILSSTSIIKAWDKSS